MNRPSTSGSHNYFQHYWILTARIKLQTQPLAHYIEPLVFGSEVVYQVALKNLKKLIRRTRGSACDGWQCSWNDFENPSRWDPFLSPADRSRRSIFFFLSHLLRSRWHFPLEVHVFANVLIMLSYAILGWNIKFIYFSSITINNYCSNFY